MARYSSFGAALVKSHSLIGHLKRAVADEDVPQRRGRNSAAATR
jgi:hypothetical protein